MSVLDMPSPREAARLLGGELGPDGVISCPGPDHSRRDRSLRVWVTGDEIKVHSFAGDDPLHCRDYVRDVLGFPSWEPGRSQRPYLESRKLAGNEAVEQDSRRRREIARALWAHSVPGPGSLVETYLRGRGIAIDQWPVTLRLLPARPPDHLWPALIAAYGIPLEPEPGTLLLKPDAVVGVQLTCLQRDGSGKAPIDPVKRTIGRNHTMPIVLAPMTDSLGLVIAEGIEDALTLHIETGLAAWAAGGASRMPSLAAHVPQCVESVTIVADTDDAGMRGAMGLRDALRDRDAEVRVIAGIGGRNGATGA